MNKIEDRKMSFELQQRTRATSMPSITPLQRVVPVSKNFGDSFKILFRWEQSIYRLLWKHALLYYGIYIVLSCMNYFILEENGQRIFRDIAKYCWRNTSSINLAIMLGFFTSTAIQRLFSTLTAMPGTYSTTCTFIMSLKPNIPECRPLIAAYARWQVLSWVLTFRMVSKPLRRIFPDLASLQQEGLLLPQERMLLEQDKAKYEHDTARPLLVIEWMLLLLRECQMRDYFVNASGFLKNVDAVVSHKKKCSNIIKFGFHNIPRPLKQAVVIGVYSLGVMTLLGRDWDAERNKILQMTIDFFPVVPSLQFFVYLSWLMFGRAAVNPFGDDESDIDVPQFVRDHIEDSQRLQALYVKNFAETFDNRQPLQTSECSRRPS